MDENGTAQYVRGLNYIAKMGAVSGVNYYMYNAHGDVVQVLDGAGTVKNRYEYDPFGETVLNIEETPNEIKYAGEFQDSSTGLYYLRARYYDPGSGRFMNEDTYRGNATNPASLNLYTYCYSDPVNFVDPTGHSPEEDFEKEYEKEHGTTKGASDRNYYNARTGEYQSPYADATSYWAQNPNRGIGVGGGFGGNLSNSGSKVDPEYLKLTLQAYERQNGTTKGFYYNADGTTAGTAYGYLISGGGKQAHQPWPPPLTAQSVEYTQVEAAAHAKGHKSIQEYVSTLPIDQQIDIFSSLSAEAEQDGGGIGYAEYKAYAGGSRVLYEGIQGYSWAIKLLQYRLNDTGWTNQYYLKKHGKEHVTLDVNGVFDSSTLAVVNYYKDHRYEGVLQNNTPETFGRVGATTWRAINLPDSMLIPDSDEYWLRVKSGEGLYNRIYYKGAYSDAFRDVWVVGVSPTPKPEKGQLIFLQHGLGASITAFEATVQQLKQDNKKYLSLGYVTEGRDGRTSGMHYNDEYLSKLSYYFGNDALQNPDDYLPQMINKLTDEGLNVLVRTEFSAGNLSFEDQRIQMGNMVGRFEGHNANVTFIGHSMGGLASINYGIDYANAHFNKEVNIITVDTPYHANAWARSTWEDPSGQMANAAGQVRGEAHRDLGGHGTALSDLKNKWNNYKNNGGSATLYAIAVSMYDPNLEQNWSDKGDGVVDIPSQQGQGWSSVNAQSIIFGTGQGHKTPIQDLMNQEHDYYHTKTPSRQEVIDQIKNILK